MIKGNGHSNFLLLKSLSGLSSLKMYDLSANATAAIRLRELTRILANYRELGIEYARCMDQEVVSGFVAREV